jgi:hypothetical protein
VWTAETGPLDSRGGLTDDFIEWPIEFRVALRALAVERFDSGECAACGGPVGYGLSGDADEITTWRWVTLVRLGARPVTFLCEDCAQVLSAVGLG